MPKLLIPAALVAGALALAAALLFFTKPRSDPGVYQVPQAPAAADQTTASSTIGSDGAGAGFNSSAQSELTSAPAANALPAVATGNVDAAEPERARWENSINAILESPEGNDSVAARLAAMMPTLPPDGQAEAAQHMVNLMNDEKYKMAVDLMMSPTSSQQVKEIIYADTLNRPNTVKLPALVNMLGLWGNPLRQEALGTLQVFTGKDFDNDAQAWNFAVQEFLREEARQETEGATQASAP